jgi:hypothetical protein
LQIYFRWLHRKTQNTTHKNYLMNCAMKELISLKCKTFTKDSVTIKN